MEKSKEVGSSSQKAQIREEGASLQKNLFGEGRGVEAVKKLKEGVSSCQKTHTGGV